MLLRLFYLRILNGSWTQSISSKVSKKISLNDELWIVWHSLTFSFLAKKESILLFFLIKDVTYSPGDWPNVFLIPYDEAYAVTVCTMLPDLAIV